MSTSPFAVIPVVILPLSLLAMLFAALLAWPLAALRKWWVILNVAIMCVALYVVRFTFEGLNRRLAETDALWAKPAALWVALSLVALAGAGWMWYRKGMTETYTVSGTSEKIVLVLLSGACVSVAAYRLWGGGPDWNPLLVVSFPVWVGTLSVVLMPRLGLPHLMPQEVMLCTLAVACAACGLASWFT